MTSDDVKVFFSKRKRRIKWILWEGKSFGTIMNSQLVLKLNVCKIILIDSEYFIYILFCSIWHYSLENNVMKILVETLNYLLFDLEGKKTHYRALLFDLVWSVDNQGPTYNLSVHQLWQRSYITTVVNCCHAPAQLLQMFFLFRVRAYYIRHYWSSCVVRFLALAPTSTALASTSDEFSFGVSRKLSFSNYGLIVGPTTTSSCLRQYQWDILSSSCGWFLIVFSSIFNNAASQVISTKWFLANILF